MRPRSEGVDRPLREGGWETLSASALPYGPETPVPRAAAPDDLERVRAAFAEAAGRAAEADFDLLVLDASHGYLLASFLSPLTNSREDEYGGSVENRLRFPLAVLEAVRAAWPPERPLGLRFTADDWARGGLPQAEAMAVAAAFRERGADFLEPVAGQTVPGGRPVYGRLFLVPYSDVIRNELSVPTLTAGGITTRDEMNTILAAGRADLCVLDPRVYTRAARWERPDISARGRGASSPG